MGSVVKKKKKTTLFLKEWTIIIFNSNNQAIMWSLSFHLSQLKKKCPFLHITSLQKKKKKLQLLDFTARNCNNIYYMRYNRMDVCFQMVFLTLLIFNTLVLTH